MKSGLEDKCKTVDAIVRILQSAGSEVFMDPKRIGSKDCATNLPEYTGEDEIDLLLVIGGDGTILRAVRELSDCTNQILGINRR